jgi:hypothetical protein
MGPGTGGIGGADGHGLGGQSRGIRPTRERLGQGAAVEVSRPLDTEQRQDGRRDVDVTGVGINRHPGPESRAAEGEHVMKFVGVEAAVRTATDRISRGMHRLARQAVRVDRVIIAHDEGDLGRPDMVLEHVDQPQRAQRSTPREDRTAPVLVEQPGRDTLRQRGVIVLHPDAAGIRAREDQVGIAIEACARAESSRLEFARDIESLAAKRDLAMVGHGDDLEIA